MTTQLCRIGAGGSRRTRIVHGTYVQTNHRASPAPTGQPGPPWCAARSRRASARRTGRRARPESLRGSRPALRRAFLIGQPVIAHGHSPFLRWGSDTDDALGEISVRSHPGWSVCIVVRWSGKIMTSRPSASATQPFDDPCPQHEATVRIPA